MLSEYFIIFILSLILVYNIIFIIIIDSLPWRDAIYSKRTKIYN